MYVLLLNGMPNKSLHAAAFMMDRKYDFLEKFTLLTNSDKLNVIFKNISYSISH